MEIRTLTLDEWGDVVAQTDAGPFHQPATLAVLDRYEPGELQLLGGYRGQEPVGLFPVFVRELFSFRFVVSPPPGLSVPWLGPVLIPSSPKQRKREKLNEEFTEAALGALDTDDFRTLFGMVSPPQYVDPRPYLWTGHTVDPRFNVVLDLADRQSEELLNAFTRDLRKEIRKGDDLGIEIKLGGPTEAARVTDDLADRFAEQGLTFETPQALARELATEAEAHTRVYVARDPAGSYLGGITLLYANGDAIFWQGGTKANYEGVSINSLLHWAIIEDILREQELASVERYHFGNGLNRRIARYKSKFDATPVVNYEIKSTLMVAVRKVHTAKQRFTVESIAQKLPTRSGLQ